MICYNVLTEWQTVKTLILVYTVCTGLSDLIFRENMVESVNLCTGLTGDEEVPGSILAGSGNILLWRWIMKRSFYSHSLPSAGSRRAVVSFW